MFRVVLLFVLVIYMRIKVQSQAEPPLPPDSELDALSEISKELGKEGWNFSENPCNKMSSWFTPSSPPNVADALSNSSVTCNCSILNGKCHVDAIYLRGQDLVGLLPRSITKLPYLKTIDLTRNYLNGTIPREWASTNLEYVSVSVNRFSGPIPDYLGNITTLRYLDLSFNRLEGNIPNFESLLKMDYMYLTSNLLTGDIPEWMKRRESRYYIDISYNNLSESSQPPSSNTLNLFQSSSEGNKLENDNRPMMSSCSKDYYSVHINCGGGAVVDGDIVYDADQDQGGPATYLRACETWETSNTGFFWDTSPSASSFIANGVSIVRANNSELYTDARLSPLSLTYYLRCLANGTYSVTLYFAEIVIRDNRSFYSLGRRIFDIYVQEKREFKNFNIENEAKGVDKPVIKTAKAVVSNKTLTIRFHWAGKGTTAAPARGTYGPLISAISVESGNLMELVDPRLGTEFNKEEAIRMTNVALLCTNPSPALRPIMSAVVSMLEGKTHVPELILDPTIFGDGSRLSALRNQCNQILLQSKSGSCSLIQSSDAHATCSTSSGSA
ncbi:hypothetical protein SLEP1_g59707 [Rubroshorea leprosula]|uniref:non-specific serine/threonine protein kinase n=1 Tax=Rubroshorea leprosula TaxID=152421 RepID=A0AAV5MUB1_9ROSI|nr:hypothetical protein SLEP1_g59707 [Rubroshorea leprosula]